VKRVIDFYVTIDQVTHASHNEVIRVVFEWDGQEEIVKAAARTLEQEIGNIPDLIEYFINDWEWIENDQPHPVTHRYKSLIGIPERDDQP
jgi:hypothetical protein